MAAYARKWPLVVLRPAEPTPTYGHSALRQAAVFTPEGREAIAGAPVRSRTTPVSAKLSLASLSADATHDQAVEADLDAIATVRHCATGDELLDLILAGQVNAVVGGLLDRAGASVAPLIAKAHRQYPDLRMVIDVPATPAAFQQLPAVLWAGASEVSIGGYDRLRDTIETVLAPDWQPGAGRSLLETVPPMVPDSLKAFAIACALKGSPRLTVERVAAWVRTSPRTIRSHLRRAGLSSPLAFVRYCSAAHATCLLYPQRLHPDRVVERMRFGTRRALRDLIEHYSGDETEVVPERWAYAALLLRAERFLQRQPAPRWFRLIPPGWIRWPGYRTSIRSSS